MAKAPSEYNPFPASDPERRTMWEMLVERDFVAFVNADWSLMADDFWAEGFYGLDAKFSRDPSDWKISFPTVESYRDEWLRQAPRHEGSWWEEWARFLVDHSGRPVTPPPMGGSRQAAASLDDAPGHYVLQR